MAEGGESAMPSAVASSELAMAGEARGGVVHIDADAGTFGSRLGAAAARRGIHLAVTYDNSDELACHVRVGAGRGDPGVVYVNLGEFAGQARPGTGRGNAHAGMLRVMNRSLASVYEHDNSGMFGHQLVGDFAQHPHPGAGRDDDLVHGVLRGDLGLLRGNSGTIAPQLRQVAGREDELMALLREGHGAVYDSSGNFGRQVRDPNPGTQSDAVGTLAERLRSLLPVAGIVASSAAVTGLAAGTAPPAAGFGLFVLLLGGLSLVTIHVLRA